MVVFKAGGGGGEPKILKNSSRFCFSRNSNLNAMKFYFDNSVSLKLVFTKFNELLSPLRKDILRRILSN